MVSNKAWNNSLSFWNKNGTLWLLMNRITCIVNRFKLVSNHFHLKRFIKLSELVWIDSNLFWIVSNTFWAIWVDSNISWHVSFFIIIFPCLIWFEWIQIVSESIHTVHFVRKFRLSPCSYILYYPHNSNFIESFASILSRSQKLIVHAFFKIKHFFLESLCSLSV